MQVQRAATMADYLRDLRENPQEAQALFADLLISVTTFFRDTSAFDKLAALVIPRLFDGQRRFRYHPRLGSWLRHWRRSLFDCNAAA